MCFFKEHQLAKILVTQKTLFSTYPPPYRAMAAKHGNLNKPPE